MMKRTYLGICCIAILCMVWTTGCCTCKAPEKCSTAQPNRSPTDQKTIADLQSRIEKLELFAVLQVTGYLSHRNEGPWIATVSLPHVIQLCRSNNRYAEQWVKDIITEISVDTEALCSIASMYATHYDPFVRDKDKALKYALLADSHNSANTNILSRVQSSLACAYAINGDFKKAVAAQENAIRIKRQAMQNMAHKNSRFIDPSKAQQILDKEMAPLEQALELYKKGVPVIQTKRGYYYEEPGPSFMPPRKVSADKNKPNVFDLDLPPFGSDQ